ncbi:MAG: glycosyltransferase family 9 protein [Gemmatimonadaceae bacterium]|nr:glycosyltransferase family 9 protein [Gemmatimonadaceae bacterium]
MVLTTPLLERLAREGLVHVVATPANAAVLANHPAVASVIAFDKRGADRGWRGVRRVADALKATGATRAFMAQGSLRTASLAWLAGIPERIGFATSSGRVLYTRRVPYAKDQHHAVRLWQLASPAGDTSVPTSARPSLYPGAVDQDAVDALLRAAGVADGEPLIALAPGSVWATKRWPSYDALAAELARSTTGARLVVLGAGGDTPLAAAIAAAVAQAGGPPVVDATGRLSLLGSAALLARARLLVTNDSAPLHLASAMNTPTVAVFGPTVPALGFGPLAERQTVVERYTLGCRPCNAHGPQQCPLKHWRCMRDLPVGRMMRAITELERPTQ